MWSHVCERGERREREMREIKSKKLFEQQRGGSLASQHVFFHEGGDDVDFFASFLNGPL
jgi:hypothetical protein